MAIPTGTTLAEAVEQGMTIASNNFEDALAAIQKNGKELSMQDILKAQIDVGISSLFTTLISSIIKEWIDAAKGTAQKVG